MECDLVHFLLLSDYPLVFLQCEFHILDFLNSEFILCKFDFKKIYDIYSHHFLMKLRDFKHYV